MYTNDQILVAEKLTSECKAKNSETKDFKFQIPQSIFLDDDEE